MAVTKASDRSKLLARNPFVTAVYAMHAANAGCPLIRSSLPRRGLPRTACSVFVSASPQPTGGQFGSLHVAGIPNTENRRFQKNSPVVS